MFLGAAECPPGVSRALPRNSQESEDSPGPAEQLGETLLQRQNLERRGKQLQLPAIALL